VIEDITAKSIGPKTTRTLQHIFPQSVIGAMSQYHTVVIVTIPHQSECGIDAKSALTGFSK